MSSPSYTPADAQPTLVLLLQLSGAIMPARGAVWWSNAHRSIQSCIPRRAAPRPQLAVAGRAGCQPDTVPSPKARSKAAMTALTAAAATQKATHSPRIRPTASPPALGALAARCGEEGAAAATRHQGTGADACLVSACREGVVAGLSGWHMGRAAWRGRRCAERARRAPRHSSSPAPWRQALPHCRPYKLSSPALCWSRPCGAATRSLSRSDAGSRASRRQQEDTAHFVRM